MERKIKLYVDRTSKHIIFVYLDYVLYSNLTRFVSIKHKAPVLYDTGNLRIWNMETTKFVKVDNFNTGSQQSTVNYSCMIMETRYNCLVPYHQGLIRAFSPRHQ